MAALSTSAQTLRNLYRPPDPEHEDAPPVARRGVDGSQIIGKELHGNGSAIRRLKGLLPTLALETSIVLECARDAWYTGGIAEADGIRLRQAFERLKRIAQVVADAEREVYG